ncbi:MAG: cation transporter [Actinomycetia bacterium]|nr:cation transporter [Actinomycetes bacterium]
MFCVVHVSPTVMSVGVGIVVGIAFIWVALVAALLVAKPDAGTLTEAARIVPDVVRLVRRLAADKTLPGRVRLRLALLLVYLASPIDFVPDFIPVIGFADDVIVTSLVLRSVIKGAGVEALERHWPGTPTGLATLGRLCRLPEFSAPVMADAELRRRGVALEGITLGWNVIGIVVLAVAAIAARSVALAGFGLDSLIEIGASTVVLWELSGTGEDRQRKALRAIGIAFVTLAVYLAIQSTYVLVRGYHPRHSVLGIAWTATTAVVMFGLAAGKTRVGRDLDNPVLRTEGRVTLVDALLATAVLVGLALNAAVGWWWADPAAAYVIFFYGLKEGRAAFLTD